MDQFQFESLEAFFIMKGHGTYVWAAYAITFTGIIALVLQSRSRKKSLIQRIKMLRLQSNEVVKPQPESKN